MLLSDQPESSELQTPVRKQSFDEMVISKLSVISGYLRVHSLESKFDDRFLDQMKKTKSIDMSKICLYIDLKSKDREQKKSKQLQITDSDGCLDG